jgi:aspartyl-tRNA(Asn)/glutamyl-tRNA(Gln) amidotransferase subunit C
MATTFTPKDVEHIAKLANIPVTEKEKEELAEGFTKTIAVVDTLNALDVSDVPSTHMTDLKNVFREDVVDTDRMFTQEQALANAVKTDNGYIVVEQIIDQEE